MKEQLIGIVDHYFGHVGVVAFELQGDLQVGDTIHIKGHTSDLTQEVESMQIEHEDVETASPGDQVGIKVSDRVRVHDTVYRVG